MRQNALMICRQWPFRDKDKPARHSELLRESDMFADKCNKDDYLLSWMTNPLLLSPL